MTTNQKMPIKQLTGWELLIIFIGFISIVCLIISVYAAHLKEKFYPWGPVAYGGPWNIPTRYPIRGWGWDIRGYPAPYPQDYPQDYLYYGYPGGQPAYPAPQPEGSNSGTAISSNTKSDKAAPFGIQMTEKLPTAKKTNKPITSANNKPSIATNQKVALNEKQNELLEERAAEEKAADEWYEKESRWWPDWVSWPWMPYFNYGLHYDVNGKLKQADNDSIVANHAWSWW